MRGWALIVALALAGCGKKKPPEAPANTTKATDDKPDASKQSKHAPDDADGAPGGGGGDEDPCAGGK